MGRLIRCANGVELRLFGGVLYHDGKRVFIDCLSRLGCIPTWTHLCDEVSAARNAGRDPQRLVISREMWRKLQQECFWVRVPALYSFNGEGPRVASVPIVVVRAT